MTMQPFSRPTALRRIAALELRAALVGCVAAGAGTTPAAVAAATHDATAAAAIAPAIAVTDDQGRRVELAAPARRAVTLAPHATELVYAAGAGAALAGTVRGSDYPPQARALPSIGDGVLPDAERVAALRPDLLVAWLPGAMQSLQPVLDALHVPVFYSDPRTLADIPRDIRALGRLFGTTATADANAAALQARLDRLQAQYAGRAPVRVFIEAGREPLYSLNRSSIVNDAVRLCGGVNVYADNAAVAPQVTVESVLEKRPGAVIVGTGGTERLDASRLAWRQAGLPAALAGHVYGIDADLLYRPGPRLVDAAEALCGQLDAVRSAR
jgi:iron complex transport system substrate-binding protein/vitamin B12 transport system substrate-binding protein